MSDPNEKVHERKEHHHRTAKTARLLDRQTMTDRMSHGVRLANPPTEHYHKRAALPGFAAFMRDRLPQRFGEACGTSGCEISVGLGEEPVVGNTEISRERVRQNGGQTVA
jgi:hypothetical protein